MYIAHALLADASEKFSLARLLERYVRASNLTGRSYADHGLRIFTLSPSRIQMGMYIHGKETGFGASIPLSAFFLPLVQFHPRYKNRLQLDPEARCIGVDMNRYAVLTVTCFTIFSQMVDPVIGIGWDFSFMT